MEEDERAASSDIADYLSEESETVHKSLSFSISRKFYKVYFYSLLIFTNVIFGLYLR